MSIDSKNRINSDRILKILDHARWAPSGDNTQPWRFEILGEDHLVVHGHDTRHTVVYDLQGHASQLAIGALLESIAIAATKEGLKAEFTYRSSTDESEEHPLFDVYFKEDSSTPDPLFPYLETRSVNRRPFGTRPITNEEKFSLHLLMEPWSSTYEILWLERKAERFAMANITQRCGKLRLTIPEAYRVHKAVIEWNARFSQDRIPDQALGLSRFILPLMHWIMGSWARVRFFNRFLGGTLIPRIQLDILPALFSSAHFVLLAPSTPETLMDYVKAGRALCRFWLGVTSLGLQFQPEMTPLIFGSYAKQNVQFSSLQGAMGEACQIASMLERVVGEHRTGRAVFIGRVGRGPSAPSRSLRLPVESLLKYR